MIKWLWSLNVSFGHLMMGWNLERKEERRSKERKEEMRLFEKRTERMEGKVGVGSPLPPSLDTWFRETHFLREGR